jgi:hypothetical protein
VPVLYYMAYARKPGALTAGSGRQTLE